MKRPLLTYLIALTLGALHLLCPGDVLAFRCGVQRWQVKTGTDSDIASVNWNLDLATPTTIDYLINLAEPNDRRQSNRVAPIETTVYTLDARLTFWKWENDSHSGDWDYHLVFTDPDGHTIGGEIPFPDCVDDASPVKALITAARQLFDSDVKPQGQNVSIPARVTGIGFFDLHTAGHNPTGSAANGIELHPILKLELNPSAPAPTATPTPTPTPAPTSAGGGSGSVTVNGGFETAKHSGMSADGWTATRKKGPQHDVVIVNGSYPNSGQNYALLGARNNVDEVLAQTVAVPSGHATLTFYASIVTAEAEDADPYDILTVEIRDLQGHLLTTVASLSNQDFAKSNDDASIYFKVSADLTTIAGEIVTLAFHAKTDSASVTTFRIDDVSIAR